LTERDESEPMLAVIEICTSVLRDLEDDTLGAHQRELLDLRGVAQRLDARIASLVRGG